MATVHRIKIQENPHLVQGAVRAIRTSKSRVYGACVVGTATAKRVEDGVLTHADNLKAFAAVEILVSELVVKAGMTVEAAKAHHEAMTKPWFEALFANERAFINARKRSGQYYPLTPTDREDVRAATVAQGHVDPYTGVVHELLEAAQRMRGLERAIEWHEKLNVKVGDQFVAAWSRDVGLAGKALASWVKHYGPKGYTFEIRTDIEVTET